ncbi:MAG: hypothetical protein ABR509_05325 [Candidatus Limnocylindria bacterium]
MVTTQLVGCPRCATPRVGSARYCTCGFDYWRAAQQQALAGVAPRRRRKRHGLPATIARSVALSATLLLGLAALGVTLAALPGQTGGSLLDQLSGGRLAFGRIGQQSALYDGPGSEIVRSFVALAARPDVSFHVDFTGTVSVGDGQGDDPQQLSFVEATLDVAANDWSGFVDASSVRETVAADVIYKNGVAWARPPGALEWQGTAFQPTQPMNPFVQLEGPEEVDYQGTSVIDGQVLHHLHIAKWLGGDLATVFEGLEVTSTDTSFDVYTTDGGVPVYANLTQTLHAEIEGQPATIQTPAEYRFSNWGSHMLIEAPGAALPAATAAP